MNHLEQLVAEWLEYRGYFVRTSVAVGPRARGGFEGELDVVAFHPELAHFVHVECSLDALSEAKREERFTDKSARGRMYAPKLFSGLTIPTELDQVLLLQFTGGKKRAYGRARLLTVREFIHEIFQGLEGTTPQRKAVPTGFPLLRTLQLAAYAQRSAPTEYRLTRAPAKP